MSLTDQSEPVGPVSAQRTIDRAATRLPAFTVARPRLEGALDAVVPGGVGLVVAPAGSGKSILLSQWMRNAARPVCHLQVIASHDDPVVFARALTSAIDSVAPSFDASLAQLVSAAGAGLGTVFLSSFLVALELLDGELTIVLDDVHLLTSSAICSDLDDLIERLPDNVRLVLSARWDPPLRLQPLRLASRMVEIRTSDLAFGSTESRALLETVSGRSLTADQTDALVTRTDGWAVGLQLAAISLQRVSDVSAFVDDFTGSDQMIADYLAEEVIDDLEPELRRFLLHTSILDWLDTDLCNAVTGDDDAEEVLDLLARRSLFLVHPAGGGARLRYHHLFADLLRYRLRASGRDDEPQLRRRAATWLLDHGEVTAAIEQLLAAGDIAEVVRVIGEHGQGYFEREESATLAHWLTEARAQKSDLPAAVDVNLLAAQVTARQTGAAVETYRRVRRREDLSAGETAASAAIYACLGLDDLPTSEVHRAASEAIDLLASSEVVCEFIGVGGRDTVEYLAATMSAIALLHDGCVTESARALEAVLDLPGAQYRVWKAYAMGALALASAFAGRSNHARALAATTVDFAEANDIAHHRALAYAHFALARVALDQGERTTATYHLHEAGSRAERSEHASLRSLHRLLRIEHVAETVGPERALEELRASAPVTLQPVMFAELQRVQELHLLVATGKLGQARVLLETERWAPALIPAVIDLELAAGDVVAARTALDAWDPHREVRSEVQRLLCGVAVSSAEGEQTRAHQALEEALDWAEPELLRQPFLAQPTAMRILRQDAPRRSRPFARSIVGASAPANRQNALDQLVEPLTDREREVLGYLPTRFSNSEIAAGLYISINTLKTHLAHIYIKLAVANRNEAVARAIDLGIL